MKLYASLVENNEVRESILGRFLDEFEKTQEMLNLLLDKSLKERRRNHYFSNQLRAIGMDEIHQYQVETIKKWRKVKKSSTDSEELLVSILLSVNVLAGAMRNTG